MESPIYRARGHYGISVVTGAIAAGAGGDSEVLQFRWTDTDHLAVITEVRLMGMRATTAFAAGNIDVKLSIARDWTADGSGGTRIVPGGDSDVDNGQLRTTMRDSLVNTMRVATTGALTAGTKTIETTDLGLVATNASGGFSAATPIIGSIYLPVTELYKADIANGQYPLVLSTNEGFVVRATVPATGVWNLGMQVKWCEVAENEL